MKNQDICDGGEINVKANFQNNYLDHMSNLKIKSNESSNTLTSIACGVCTYKHGITIADVSADTYR